MPQGPPIDQADAISALAADFSDVARDLFAAHGERDTLQEVVALAMTTIEGCDFGGIFLVEEDTVTRPVRSSTTGDEMDAIQLRTGRGPCLDAIAHRAALYASDLLEEERWPEFAAVATANGMRSVLAVPLLGDGTLGALNLYSRYPLAFGVVDRARGLLVAALATTALLSARSREVEERQAEHLRAALATREIIGQAQGILMERERIAADQAFDVLRRASQHLNLKLREVAQTLVDTGETPRTEL